MAAFSDSDKARIRRYLGHPDRFGDVNSALESVMDSVSDEHKTIIISLLDACDSVQAKIEALVTNCAAVVTVDGIQKRMAYALGTLRSIGRGHVAQISKQLGIPMHRGGAFSPGGFSEVPGPMGTGRYPPFP